MPRKPIAPAFSQTERGTWPSFSHWEWNGTISRATNWRTASRNITCSEVRNWACMAAGSVRQVLKNAGGAHAPADAHCHHAVAGAAALHLLHQLHGQLGAGAAQRVTQRNGAAVDVGDRLIQPQLADDGH